MQTPLAVRKDQLGERVLLADVAFVNGAGKADVEPLAPSTGPPVNTSPLAPPSSMMGTSAEELQLMLCIMEVELRNWELEVEAMHLWVKALELQRHPSSSIQSPLTLQAPPIAP